MESKRTATTYFIPPGKFLLVENALGNPDLIQSSVSSDCRVTIVDSANFPLDELEQFPTFRLTSADIKLKLGDGAYYIYIVVPTPDNTESTSAFISYNTALVDRDGYQVIETEDKEGNPKLEKGELLGKSGFKYYQCGVISARGGNASAITAPAGQGRLLSVDLGVNPQYANLDKKVDWDFFFSLFKPHYDDPKNPTKLTWIEAKSHMGIQGGVTMYAMDKDVDVPSLASGLPFDRRTIWYNPDTQQIEVIGGTGGGSGEGVSNFWDLSGIPSWITISKPKYTYSEIEGTPDLSAFATQDWIKSQGYASAEELKKYIPISGYTEVSGEKNFTGGLKVNGSPIYYDTEKKYWKLEGDLLVTGGVTMYGSDSSFTPSTIMDAIAVDGTTISKSGGVLKVIGGTGGGVADSVAWANITGKPTWIGSSKPTYSYSEITGAISTTELQNYLTQNSYLNVTEGDNRYLKLSGGTLTGKTSISARLSLTNGTYLEFVDKNESIRILGVYPNKNDLSYYNGAWNKVWHEGNDGNGSGLDADLLDGLNSSDFSRSFVDIGANNYKGNGLGYTYATAAHGGACAGGFISFGDTAMYGCQINGDFGGKSLYFRGINEGSFTSWKQIAFTDSNVASATKLQTARTIWGQSFDGTGNIENKDLHLYKNSSSYTGNWAFSICVLDSSGSPLQKLGFFGTGNKFDYTYIGESYASPLVVVRKEGNVGIGTASPAYKLDVNGSASINGNAYIGTSSSTTLTLMRGGYNYIKTPESGSLVFNMNGSSSGLATSSLYLGGSFVILGYNGAKVGIGVSPTCALHVSGDILATGGITTNDSVTINGIKLSKSKDGVLYLDGNLVVKGGVTMYGTNSTTAPSIFDSLPIASTTTKGIAYFDSEFFSVGSDGKVTFIGKTDGFNATELQNYLTQNSYLNITSGDNRYLKLSGGTITGRMYYKGIIHEFHTIDGTLDGMLRSNSYDLQWYKNSSWSIILHSGNYSNYALPLSGGTLTGSNAEILKINRTSGNPLIQFQANGSIVGFLGVNTGGEAVFVDSKTYTQRLWHSGNDGVDSGLDADLLDGKEGSWYIRNVLNFQEAKGTSTSGGYDLNVLNDGLVKNYASSSYWANAPVGFGYGMVLNLKTSSSNSLLGQLAWDVNHNSTTDTTRSLHWRTIQNDTKTEYAKWHQIAFTDSNVESATKLQKARTIWGKSFDGTSDIDGIFRSISSDITSGSPFHKILAYPNSPYGLITRLYTNGEASLQAQRESDDSQTFNLILQPLGGNVGIGTPSPSYNLDVNGTFRCNSIVTGVGSPVALLNVKGIIATTDYIHLFVTGGTNKARPLVVQNGYGNVGIGVAAPTHKLHVVGNTYLNGDVFADELNTFDVLPRTSNAYSCGNSSLRWYQVYGNIGDFSGAVNMGSTLNVTGMTTMTNATITGDLRLKDSTNYGRTIYFGDGELCYLEEASDDVLTIYANAGIKLNTSSTSYNVSINTNLLVSGGITMYSQRSLKNIQDERGLSLDELRAIKPIRYTWKDNRDNRLHFGGIADDIQQVLPEVVYKTNDGVLTMDYGNAAFAIASSLINPVVDHEKRIAMLEEENKQLRQEVERLKSA